MEATCEWCNPTLSQNLSLPLPSPHNLDEILGSKVAYEAKVNPWNIVMVALFVTKEQKMQEWMYWPLFSRRVKSNDPHEQNILALFSLSPLEKMYWIEVTSSIELDSSDAVNDTF